MPLFSSYSPIAFLGLFSISACSLYSYLYFIPFFCYASCLWEWGINNETPLGLRRGG